MLGPLLVDGRADLTRRDRVVLAALLLHHPADVSVDRLGEALWPGRPPPASATKVVQGCVARLRSVLGGEAIRTSGQGYRIEVPPDDAEELERGLRRTEELLALDQPDRAAHTVSALLALWRGPPYPDLDLWGGAATEVARLQELRMQAEELHVAALLGRGDHDAALVRAAGMVDAEPHRERRWCQLALAEFGAGRQADALASLRTCRALLRDDLGVDPGSEVTSLEQAILRHDDALLTTRRPTAASQVCPWPGLAPFDTDASDAFFGRETDLVSALAQLRARGVLVVAGPSGVGKSSFVRAGVAAALRTRGSRVRVLTPSAVDSAAADVLVVDQAEEIFVLPDRGREALLGVLTEQASSGFLVLALRAERVADAAQHPDLARLVEQGLFLLSGLDEAGQRRAVEGPAAREGLHVEPGLVDLLVRDLEGEAGALPLLSHALVQTWERRVGATLTVEGYRSTGGVRGAVAHTAEQLYAGLTSEEQVALPALMLRLVAAGPTGEPLAARVPRSVLGPTSHVLLETLVDSRLVTSDAGMVTLAHESLVSAWPRLRGWLDDDVEGRRVLQHLSSSAQAWQGLGRPASELYRGVRLARVREWRDASGFALSSEEEQFLDAAVRLAADEERGADDRLRRQARSNRRLRVLAGALGLTVVGALAIGGIALGQSRRADRAATTASRSATDADARSLGARALLADDPARALLLAAAAVRLGPSADTRAALATVLARRPHLIGVADLPAGTVTSDLATGPDGTLYATDRSRGVFAVSPGAEEVVADRAGTSQQPDVWETALVAAGATDPVVAVAADQLDRLPVRLLDPLTLAELPDQLGGWPRRRVGVSALAADASGRFLAATMATATIDSDTAGSIDGGRTMVWDLAASGRRVVASIRTPANFFNGVALSPDGQVVYVTNPLTAYRVSDARRLWTSPDANWHIEISVSPDGRRLATADAEDPGAVALVDARTGRVVDRLPGHSEAITGIAWSPDGRLLAASAADGRAVVWDARTLQPVDEIEVGVEQVTGVAFDGDDVLHTLTSSPAQIQAWDLGGYRSFVQRRRVLDPVVASSSTMIRVNHAGTMAATLTTQDDGTRIGVVDATSPVASTRDLASLDLGYIGAGGWSSDDTRYATGYDAGVVQVVDTATGRQLARGRVLGGMVAEVAFSADDDQLLVAGVDGGVRRVDPDTLEPTGPEAQVPEKIYAATISPDGRSAFVAAGGTLWRPYWQEVIDHWYVVDLARGSITDHGDVGVSSAFYTAYSPDGSRVAVAGRGGDVALVDLRTGGLVREPVPTHDGAALWLDWDPTGRFFTSGSTNGEVALLDGRSGDLLGRTSVPRAGDVAVGGFRADGTLLIATSSGWLGVWDPGVEASIDFACGVAGRDLTREEWAEVVPGRAWRSTCPTGTEVSAAR